MTRSLRPRCAGSDQYGPHHVSVEHGYTVIKPGGRVIYCCDTDCLRRHLDALEERVVQSDLRELRRVSR